MSASLAVLTQAQVDRALDAAISDLEHCGLSGRQACEWFRIDAADGGPDATLR